MADAHHGDGVQDDAASTSSETTEQVVTVEEQEDFLRLLKQLNLAQSVQQAHELQREHRFWGRNLSPAHVTHRTTALQIVHMDPSTSPKTPDQVRQEPYHMPLGFTWSVVDVMDPSQADELYELLTRNYVEDDDCTFRFDYSVDFLQWALKPQATARTGTLACAVRTTTSSWPSSAASQCELESTPSPWPWPKSTSSACTSD